MQDSTRKSAGGPTLIGSVQRALRLLSALEHHGGRATAKQLARDTRLPLATTYHLLRTLQHEGAVFNEYGHYLLPPPITTSAPRREFVQTWLDGLGRDLHTVTYLAVHRAGDVEVTAVSWHPLCGLPADPERLSATAYAHAAGQSLLARLSEEQQRAHLARHPVERLTPYTAPDTATALTRLARIPPFSPVVELQELAIGYASAAVPVSVGALQAAVAFSVRMERSGELGSMTAWLRARTEDVLRSLT
ncbi:helix-turn-helix domain-containing protein [Streptomyces flavofungini]|uniref:helix-turn-helix domain-containing protein n=1 Tax=Streptomyces flavofungini TaxID=68200 RepID=UPI0034DEA50D